MTLLRLLLEFRRVGAGRHSTMYIYLLTLNGSLFLACLRAP